MAKETMSGSEIEEIKTMAAAHFWPHSRQAGDMSEETGVKVMVRGEGIWVEDAQGEKWLDVISGMWLKNIGHGRTEIADAVYEQMLEISYTPGGTVAPATARLAAKVASIAPDKDSRIFFVSGGSEAVETAMKMARKFHRNNGQPSRFKLIARNGSYHGSTFLDMSLGGGGVANPADFAPLMPYVYNISQPGEYNCHFCKDNSGCDLACARELERTILQEGSDTVAAFLGEPISVSSGVHIPHPDYWPTIREICDKYGVLLVCDEVITGFGRTGKWFATEHWGIKPDITTVAKALTSGYQPIGAAIASKAVADSFIGDPSATFKHLITFGGNPAACAAGLVNLEIMEREDLIGNSERMGTYLYERLQDFYEHPIVGEVRGGMGLLAAVQLVKDKDTRERFPAEAGLVQKATESMNKRGILTRIMGDSLHIAPPLSITKDEVDHLVESLEGVVTDLQDSLLGRIR